MGSGAPGQNPGMMGMGGGMQPPQANMGGMNMFGGGGMAMDPGPMSSPTPTSTGKGNKKTITYY